MGPFGDIAGMMKDAKDAKLKLEENHKRQMAVLEEIRNLLRDILKALTTGE